MPRNPYYQGPVSDHFDGVRFHNLAGEPETDRTLSQVLRWRRSAPHNPWPRTVPVVPTQPAMAVAGLRITMIGHATVLIQTDGLNILTDPIWSRTAGPFGIGPARVAQPGVRFEDLPKIDLVLVSHNHYDHLDLDTLKRLWDRDKPVIVTSLGNDTVIRAAGVPERHDSTDCGDCPGVEALDWGDTTNVSRFDNPFSGGPPSHQPGGVVDGAALADHRVVLRFAAQRQRPSSLYGGMSCAPSGMGIPAETSCWYFRAAAFSTSDAAGFSIVAYAS